MFMMHSGKSSPYRPYESLRHDDVMCIERTAGQSDAQGLFRFYGDMNGDRHV
jgi:hypothetical protein